MISVDQAAFKMEIARDKDLEEISDLVNSAYRGESSKKGWTTEADFLGGQRTDPQSLSEMIQSTSSQSILIYRDKNMDLLGCVYLKKESNGCVYLGMLTVKPNQQAQGLGKKMIQFAETFVRKNWNCKKIRMTVITLRIELIQWYERRGFYRTGIKEPFPYGDSRFGMPTRPDLEFEVLEKDL